MSSILHTLTVENNQGSNDYAASPEVLEQITQCFPFQNDHGRPIPTWAEENAVGQNSLDYYTQVEGAYPTVRYDRQSGTCILRVFGRSGIKVLVGLSERFGKDLKHIPRPEKLWYQ
jgi:hypothetical protein